MQSTKSEALNSKQAINSNIQYTNHKQYTNYNDQNRKKPFDLEERTLEYAKCIIRLCKTLPTNTVNIEIIRQLVRSAGSVGANYREANEALSQKDFVHRMRITRKEAKESSYWLDLLKEANPSIEAEIDDLYRESRELRNIFSSILSKS
jgi:four helix bundle protein